MADQDKDKKDETKAKGNQLNIELPEELSEGQYSNLAVITHSPTEFVLDFIQVVPNVPKAKVKSRILLGPQHAKRLLRALKDNVGKYEAQFGEIKDPEKQRQGFPPLTFNSPPAQA